MKAIMFALAIFLLLGFSCEDDKRNPRWNGFIIKTGEVCGWCAGIDSLSITEIRGHYFSTIPCNAETETIELATDKEKWEELLDTFNWEVFTDVDVNTCNLCADGCDTWIVVEKDGMTHEIRFGDNSLEVEPIREFVEKLEALRQEFK